MPEPNDPMTNARQRLGQVGETMAARFLEARGYRIVARNVRADRVEMDLVARRGPLLVFVEVKARASDRAGSPAEAVDARKQRRLRRGAAAWLAGRPAEARGVRRTRFDVVTCLRCTVGETTPSGRPLSSPAPRPTPTSPASPAPPKTPASPASPASRTGGWAPYETTAPERARWWIEHWEAAF